MASQPEDEDVDEEQLELDLTKGFESVLDTLAPLLPTSRLEWHYRSQDERLIAFSNHEFYEGELITFPGIAGRGSIRHVLVAHDPSGERTVSSPGEVSEVVRLVLEHASEHPDESLGVIAMGITHANFIDEALRNALRGRPDLDPFFDERREERFFVKNLERVQGDERDAIILSVGYGKTADGRMLYRFGPLNLEGGERRLNVAVTRARLRMTVVSSFSGAEMDPAKTVRRGPQLLRDYLSYAERGGDIDIPLPDEVANETLADHLLTGIRSRGLRANVRVGSSAQWIDVAVNDPNDGERYVLAVEMDGDSYQAIPTTRDRERLRTEQLSRLGWRHHRVWALEWLRDAKGVVDDIFSRIQEPEVPHAGGHMSGELASTPDVPSTLDARGQRPNLGYYEKVDDIRFTSLVALVDWIESDGLLRTEDELIREAQVELGFQRLGTRIDQALRGAIEFARRRRSS